MSTKTADDMAYKAALTLAEHVFSNPGQSKSQILKTFGNSVTPIQFEMAEDYLKDNDIIYGQFAMVEKDEGEKSYTYRYFPNGETTIESVRKYIQSHSKN